VELLDLVATTLSIEHVAYNYQVVPVVSGNGLVIVPINYQNPKVRRDGTAVLHALEVESGNSKWNKTINGTTWATPLITTTSEVTTVRTVA
jgi:hypothetical protein